MAKKVFMIAPFDALTGNLSGDQNLQYAENNNPAYEAPNGTQYARNYRTRYVGARRGKDGLVYFQVKQTTATVLNRQTRTQMGLLGVTAAIKAAIPAASITTLKAIYQWLVDQGAQVANTFSKWLDPQIRRMLLYKQESVTFRNAAGEYVLYNPYYDSASALVISTSVWLKFADLFSITGGVYFYIDGVKFFTGGESVSFAGIKSAVNPNLSQTLTSITISGDNVLYMSQQVYTAAGVAVDKDVEPDANEKFTTIAPEP